MKTYRVYDYRTGAAQPGKPTKTLVRESLAAGDTGAVLAYMEKGRTGLFGEGRWFYVRSDEREHYERMGYAVRSVYVQED